MIPYIDKSCQVKCKHFSINISNPAIKSKNAAITTHFLAIQPHNMLSKERNMSHFSENTTKEANLLQPLDW